MSIRSSRPEKDYSKGRKHVETASKTENQNHNDGDGETYVNQTSNIEREEEPESRTASHHGDRKAWRTGASEWKL